MNEQLKALDVIEETLRNHCDECPFFAENSDSPCLTWCPVGQKLRKCGDIAYPDTFENKSDNIGQEDLKSMYIDNSMSIQAIADIYGVSYGTIRNRLIKWEIFK